jgi:hypothetical protein
MSDSFQTLIAGDNLVGFGKLPSAIFSQMVLFAKVVLVDTSAMRSSFTFASI